MTAPRASDALQLERAAVERVSSYLDFLDEIAAHGERVWPARPEVGQTREAFVAGLVQAEVAPEPGRVPQTTYWATVRGRVVGHIGLRHRLNAELAEFGGHIGYSVRPSFRARGLAKEMLRQVLRTAKAQEIGRLLLTCAPDNLASNRTILANGGVLERTIFVGAWDARPTCTGSLSPYDHGHVARVAAPFAEIRARSRSAKGHAPSDQGERSPAPSTCTICQRRGLAASPGPCRTVTAAREDVRGAEERTCTTKPGAVGRSRSMMW